MLKDFELIDGKKKKRSKPSNALSSLVTLMQRVLHNMSLTSVQQSVARVEGVGLEKNISNIKDISDMKSNLKVLDNKIIEIKTEMRDMKDQMNDMKNEVLSAIKALKGSSFVYMNSRSNDEK